MGVLGGVGGCWGVFGGCLGGVWGVFRGCLGGARGVFGGVWGVVGGVFGVFGGGAGSLGFIIGPGLGIFLGTLWTLFGDLYLAAKGRLVQVLLFQKMQLGGFPSAGTLMLCRSCGDLLGSFPYGAGHP